MRGRSALPTPSLSLCTSFSLALPTASLFLSRTLSSLRSSLLHTLSCSPTFHFFSHPLLRSTYLVLSLNSSTYLTLYLLVPFSPLICLALSLPSTLFLFLLHSLSLSLSPLNSLALSASPSDFLSCCHPIHLYPSIPPPSAFSYLSLSLLPLPPLASATLPTFLTSAPLHLVSSWQALPVFFSRFFSLISVHEAWRLTPATPPPLPLPSCPLLWQVAYALLNCNYSCSMRLFLGRSSRIKC